MTCGVRPTSSGAAPPGAARCVLRALLALLAFACLGALTSAARAEVAIPALTARVTDLTGTLAPAQMRQLDGQLAALEQRKGAQIVVLMVPSTQPDDIFDYTTKVFEHWKLGRKGVDDGVLLVVAKNDRRAMIETGYGLEGAIPDAAAARIIREYLAPKFRVDDYFGGIEDAVGALTKLVDGEALPPPLQGPNRGQGGELHGDWITGILVGWFVAVFARRLLVRVDRVPRAGLVAAITGGLAWWFSGAWLLGIVLGILGLIVGFASVGSGAFANHGGFGGWGGGGFGGGGFGSAGFGGGGGGFSGGGGATGGGGASGSW